MPRGGGGRGHKSGHKGQRRHFTSPEELEAMKEKEERERQWREQCGDESSDEEKEGSEKSESGDDSTLNKEEKTKKSPTESEQGPEIENPNRVVNKAKKVGEIDLADEAKPELSRKEREEIERQRARANYLKLHAEGKTEEARADLARLAIIKKQREEAAKKRDDERKAKEAAKAAKTENLNKALGKGRKT